MADWRRSQMLCCAYAKKTWKAGWVRSAYQLSEWMEGASGWVTPCQTFLPVASPSLGMVRSILCLEPSLCFSTVSRDAGSAPQHNANEFISSGKALEVPQRSPGWDIAQHSAEPVSVKFHTINFIGDWRSGEGQTFSCSALWFSSPFVTVIICKVLWLILFRTMRFDVSGAFTVAQVWSSSPFHLASAAHGSQLIFAHLIWEQNKGPRSFEVRDPPAPRGSEVGSRRRCQNTHS